MVESLTCDMCVTFVWQEKLHQFVHCNHRDHFNMWHSVTKVWHRMASLLSHHVTLCYTPMSLGHISINLQILLFKKYVPMVIVISNSEHIHARSLKFTGACYQINHYTSFFDWKWRLFFPCAFHILFLFLFHKLITLLNM